MATRGWHRRCEACGSDTVHGNRLCEACAYEASGRAGDCPNCGGATDYPGALCVSCCALIQTGTGYLM